MPEPRSDSYPRTTILTGADMEHCAEARVGAGQAVFFTHRSPHKDTGNEDAVAIVHCDPHTGVLAIADGAGGMRAGEQASSTALEVLAATVEEAARRGEGLRDAILTGIENANRAVLDLALGAVTTLVVAEIQGRTVRTYHVGDSVILVMGQRGRIKLQTVSHSPVGYAVEAGVMDEGEAMHHEERHLVSNMIGTPDMRVEMSSPLELAARDTVLLSSDGLSDNLHTDEIVARARKGPLLACADGLVRATRQRMLEPSAAAPSKPDDLALLLYRPDPATPTQAPR